MVAIIFYIVAAHYVHMGLAIYLGGLDVTFRSLDLDILVRSVACVLYNPFYTCLALRLVITSKTFYKFMLFGILYVPPISLSYS